ncbi:transposase IS654 family [Thermosulfidibacter takaii ABI70S6]|uniref:Mutator family transposase n=1 Tax=Thermosulfidibacter takaii (strain DSM 17441 / JCM 13301 / NBRC 103674 / ABI70S6) TaxID=1298851 RepID=A0A0S3QTX1_THET7|nr:IS256 family transposase [Thermosulfidibacter takaii]BAT71785.1 transposase IS654 family [Thermosulfidibacter takaii ABI70S6]
MDQTELLNLIQQKVMEVVKELIEKLSLEEREIYLEEHPETRANGFYERKLNTTYGGIENLRVPRTRDRGFRPHIIPYRKRTLFDLEEVVTLLFASGVSMRQVSRFINTVYGVYYSPSSVSRLANVAKETIEAWRNRRLLEEYYAIYIDATFLNITRGYTSKEPVYVVLGVDSKGMREILGFWLFGAEGESSYNWQDILRDLKRRGVKRVKIFVSDDLPGLKEAIRLEFPSADHQLCISYAVRNSLNKVRRRDKSAVAEDLRKIFTAENIDEAKTELESFARKWRKRYPQMVSYWEQNFEYLVAFLNYPKSIRPHIYTTNLLERLMKEIKRRVKVIEVFCSEEAAEKILFLVLSELNERYKRYRLLGFTKLPQEKGLAVVEN